MEHTISAMTYPVMETLLLAAKMRFLSTLKPGNQMACYFTQVSNNALLCFGTLDPFVGCHPSVQSL